MPVVPVRISVTVRGDVEHARPDVHEYFTAMARLVATRSTCPRRSVGCVIVSSDKHVLTTGYNGSFPGAPHCHEHGCLLVNGRCVRTVHAEANAVSQAARHAVSLVGSTAYCTVHPCADCLKLLASAGVRAIIYSEPYHASDDEVTSVLAMEAGVSLIFAGDLLPEVA